MFHLKNIQLLNIYCLIQLIAIFVHIATSEFLVYIFICLFLVSNILLTVYLKKITIKNLIVVGLGAIILLISGILGPVDFNQLLVSWIVGFNVLFLSILMINKATIKSLYFLLILANFILFYLAYKNNFNPEFGNDILYQKSRNYVSGTLSIFTIYYLALCRIYEEKISLILLVLLFINSILLYGRSGIAVSFLILVFGMYYRLNKILFASVTLFGVASLGVIYTFLMSETNFSEGLDTPRNALFNEYIAGALSSEYHTIFGAKISTCCTMIVSYGENPHNSFLMGHSIYGISVIIIAALMLLTVFMSRRLDMILLIIFIFLRYSLDSIGLFTYYDIALFTIVYFCLLCNQKNTNSIYGKA